jgi:hypothetical protein
MGGRPVRPVRNSICSTTAFSSVSPVSPVSQTIPASYIEWLAIEKRHQAWNRPIMAEMTRLTYSPFRYTLQSG